MFNAAKKIQIILFAFVLCACSASKEKIEGERISVLSTGADVSAPASSHAIIIPAAQENDSWAQNDFDAVHLKKNLIAAQNMELYAIVSADKGATKKAPLLSVPVIDKQIAYMQDRTGAVYAFDLKTKDLLFKTPLNPLENASYDDMNGIGLAIKGPYLFALTGFGSVFAVDKTKGDILWRHDLQIPLRTAPSVAGNILFVQTINNKLLALDTADGHQIWSYDISSEETVLAGGAVPAYDQKNEIVVTAFSNGELQAFDAKLGYPLWSNNLINTNFSSSAFINAVKASPVIEDSIVYAVGNNNRTMAVSLSSGDILWDQPIGGVNTPLVSFNTLFLISNSGTLFALDKDTGKEMWSTEILADFKPSERREIYLSGPLMINSKLLVTASNGLVYAFDPKNGLKTGSFNINEKLPFGPVVADKKLIFLTRDARLMIYN